MTGRSCSPSASEVLISLEAARQAKLIGKGLDARVHLETSEPTLSLLQRYEPSLKELFNVSQVSLAHIEHPNGETRVTTSAAVGTKCERCWSYTTDVGQRRPLSHRLPSLRRRARRHRVSSLHRLIFNGVVHRMAERYEYPPTEFDPKPRRDGPRSKPRYIYFLSLIALSAFVAIFDHVTKKFIVNHLPAGRAHIVHPRRSAHHTRAQHRRRLQLPRR